MQQLQTDIPTTEKSSTIPKSVSNTFVIRLEEKTIDQRPYRDSARILQEHIEIVAESRKMISAGKTIEWKEFLTKHERHKKR